jgi:hypothetical protein
MSFTAKLYCGDKDEQLAISARRSERRCDSGVETRGTDSSTWNVTFGNPYKEINFH